MENKSIYSKLLEVQKEIMPIKRTELNPFFSSKFFDVNAILAALKPILNKQGLVLSQPFSTNEAGRSILETWVSDGATGETLKSYIYLPENLDPQKMGSVITYYRRYAIQSLFALEAVDDDGNVASQPTGAKALGASKAEKRGVAKDNAEHDAGQTYEPIL